MNKLHEILQAPQTQAKDQFEKAFKRVFGIPAEIEEDDNSVIFTSHGEKFALDFEGTLLWYLHKTWHRVENLEGARKLWRN
jgi:hypothetical protein